MKKPKSSQAKPPQEDTFYTAQEARLLECISEGECEGFADRDFLKCVYLDRIPVKNSDGTRNYTGFKIQSRRGTPNQSIIPSIGERSVRQIPVNRQIKKSTGAVIIEVNSNDVDAISLDFQIQLHKRSGTEGSEIEYRISIKEGTAAYKIRLNKVLKAKFTEQQIISHEFPVNNRRGTVSQFFVKVEMISDDPVRNEDKVKVLRWQYYSLIVKDKIPYANLAIVGMQFDPTDFDSGVERIYRYNGLLCLIPSNATVADDGGLDFAGVWDGRFVKAVRATTDPACQMLSIAINQRFGSDNLTIEDFNLSSLYKLCQYNNQFVADIEGGRRRRFSVKAQLQTFLKDEEFIDTYCAAMCATKYEYRGQIYFWQDSPEPPTWQVTNSDIKEGKFQRSSTADTTRYGIAVVSYGDPFNFLDPKPCYVEDQAAIDLVGWNKFQTSLFGGHSYAQAYTFGRWSIFTSVYETSMITFTARAFYAAIRPGKVIEVQDNSRIQYRGSGLVLRGTATTVILDSPVRLLGGDTISVQTSFDTIETKAIQSITLQDGVSVITVTTPFTIIPFEGCNWVLRSAYVVPELFRVLDVVPSEGDPTQVTITAKEYRADKWDYVERNMPAVEPTKPTPIPSRVSLIVALKVLYLSTNKVTQVEVVFPDDVFVTSAIVEYSRDTIYWEGAQLVSKSFPYAQFNNLAEGEYFFRAASVDIENRYSTYTSVVQAMTVSEIHPDTRDYMNRLRAATPFDGGQIDAIDEFVKWCYQYGLRDASGAGNHAIEDCSPFAGQYFNGVKLWFIPGTPSIVEQRYFTEANWSREKGLNVGQDNHLRGASSLYFQTHFFTPLFNGFNTSCLGVYTTIPDLAFNRTESVAIGGINNVFNEVAKLSISYGEFNQPTPQREFISAHAFSVNPTKAGVPIIGRRNFTTGLVTTVRLPDATNTIHINGNRLIQGATDGTLIGSKRFSILLFDLGGTFTGESEKQFNDSSRAKNGAIAFYFIGRRPIYNEQQAGFNGAVERMMQRMGRVKDFEGI